MSHFDPNPGDELLLPDVRTRSNVSYRVDPAPGQPTFAYASEGAKANIYRLTRASDQSRWALKVFKPSFRAEAEINAKEPRSHLAQLAAMPNFPPLEAATRIALSPDFDCVAKFPDLGGAILMKWVVGQTCFDLFHQVQKKEIRPRPEEVVEMAREFLYVMSRLEALGVAHTDISSGNVTVVLQSLAMSLERRHADVARATVELIDLEDMWRAGMSVTTNYTPGYGHPSFQSGGSSACPEGDRYAATILVAEMLLLLDSKVAAEFAGDGYFRGNRLDPAACARFERAQKRLSGVSARFADMLVRAWNSQTVGECHPLGELLRVINDPQVDRRLSTPAWRTALNKSFEERHEIVSKIKAAVPSRVLVRPREVVKVRCASCRSLNSEAAVYCDQCGQRL